MNIHNPTSRLGLCLMIGFAWLISADRKRMNWRLIVPGVAVQLLLGLIILTVPAGSAAFVNLSKLVDGVHGWIG